MTITDTLRAFFAPSRQHLVDAPTANVAGLDSPVHASRAAALEAARASARSARDARLAELQRLTKAANEDHDRAILDAEQRAEQARQKRAAEIVAGFYATVTPLVQSWIAEPTRTTSAAIRAAVLELAERSETDLGATPNRGGNGNATRWHLLSYAFGDVLIEQFPAAVNVLGSSEMDAIGAWPLAALDNPIEFHRALATLEARLTAYASQTAGSTPNDRCARRYAALRTCATTADAMRAAEDFDTTEQRKAAEAHAAAYAPIAAEARARGLGFRVA